MDHHRASEHVDHNRRCRDAEKDRNVLAQCALQCNTPPNETKRCSHDVSHMYMRPCSHVLMFSGSDTVLTIMCASISSSELSM